MFHIGLENYKQTLFTHIFSLIFHQAFFLDSKEWIHGQQSQFLEACLSVDQYIFVPHPLPPLFIPGRVQRGFAWSANELQAVSTHLLFFVLGPQIASKQLTTFIIAYFFLGATIISLWNISFSKAHFLHHFWWQPQSPQMTHAVLCVCYPLFLTKVLIQWPNTRYIPWF